MIPYRPTGIQKAEKITSVDPTDVFCYFMPSTHGVKIGPIIGAAHDKKSVRVR